MTNRKQVQSCNTKKDHSLKDDWDDVTNNLEYRLARISKRKTNPIKDDERSMITFCTVRKP